MVRPLRKLALAIVLSASAVQASAAKANPPVDVHGHPFGYDFCNLIPNVNQRNAERLAGMRGGQISMQTFNDVIRIANQVYAPEFRRSGLTFVLRGFWQSNDANAYAYPGEDPVEVFERKAREGATLKDFNMRFRRADIHGGLARNPFMTPDGLLMVICHEIGHHLGGLPANQGHFASNEGQSDYFAATKCMRRVLSNYDNVSVMRNRQIDFLVRNKCLAAFPKDMQEAAICMRTSMAGQSLARVLASLGGEKDVRFDQPSRVAVQVTDNSHPDAQCRLDTYFQGALCRAPFQQSMNFSNIRDGACVPENLAGLIGGGVRPVCWFHPKLYERPELITRTPIGRR